MEQIRNIITTEVHKTLNPNNKEVIQLKMIKRIGLRLCIMAIALAISVLGLGQGPAQAVTCPTTSTADFDGDGFTDKQECDGIPLPNTSPDNFFPGKNSGLLRAVRLDPDTKDLFVILVPASQNSLFPDNPLEYVVAPQVQGGLGITAHIINMVQAYNPSTRVVTSVSSQKAVKVTENLDATSGNIILGMASCGTPMGLDLATIYTQRIVNHVTSVLGASNTNLQNQITTYIKHTIAHEVGHMLGPLAPKYVDTFGGNHYKTGTKVVMDQSVYYKDTTFSIGTIFADADKTKIKLR